MGMSRQSSHRAAHLQEGLLGAQQLTASQRGGPVAQGGKQAVPVPTSSCDLVSQSSESCVANEGQEVTLPARQQLGSARHKLVAARIHRAASFAAHG